MDLVVLELAQTVAISATSTGGGSEFASERIDLLPKNLVKQRCQTSSANEIIVCAPDQEEFRLRPLEKSFDKDKADAEIGVGEGATLGTSVEAGNVGGWTSNRVMFRLKIKL